MTKQVLLVLLLTLSTFGLYAQKGSITGNVKDGKTGEALIGASVFVDGTTLGTVTDFDGNYTIPNIPVGTVTVKCSFISYETSSKENINVSKGNSQSVDFVLGESTIALEDVKVVAKANRESEVVLLIDQKKSVGIKQSIGAQELATQGISDASAAATKVSGVSKQNDTKGLNVRGLGDRYNTTTLNGLPLPSNNAEFKNIDLELFSTEIIEFIDIEKVPGAHLYGDFAGANVNVVSKIHNGDPFLKIGLKTGYNSSLSDADKFYLGDGPGMLGFDNFDYQNNLDVYDFETNWNPEEKTVYPFTDISVSAGKTFEFENSKLNTFATISFDNEYQYSDLLQRQVNGSDFFRRDLSGEQYKYMTQTTGMLNVNYNWNSNNIYLNSMFLNTSEQSLKNLRGFIFDLAEEGGFVRRSEYERNTVLVNQILGGHKLNPKMNLKWGVAYNTVKNIIPDRRHNTMENGTDSEKFFATNDQANNNRYFHDLKEDDIAANISWDYKFGEGFEDVDYKGKLTVGYNGKFKNRSFESTQFNHKIITNQLTNINNIDSYFNNENLQNGLFDLKVLSSNFIILSTYDGEQIINAGFANLEYHFNSRFVALLGLRAENVYQEIEYNTVLGEGKEDFTEFKVLPSLSLKYSLSAKTNLRFASGITYTLPQFKETAPFIFEGITDVSIGNPYIEPSTNYNGELKWEYFPKPSELLSVAVFGKYISNPINRFVRASAGNEFTFGNTGDWAYVYGLEFETKKNIWTKSGENSSKKLYASFNFTVMDTKQELDAEKLKEETEGRYTANFNKEEEDLQGSASFIANTNLNYKYSWKDGQNSITSSLVYRYESERMYLIGYSSLGNQVDDELHNLDFVLKSKFNNWGLSFLAKNLLDQDIERFQKNETQDWLVKSYKKGIKFSLGLSYTF
ncbi:TonB-dependent receptor [Marinifilum sp. D737]|uniref:TonB-dependent receptor n=1 Tax=Marinifilum sp. D737 TaxID=2969628 RepID=UPI002273E47F|nr:TonB-dependent receptor [Marinifilum sp. D737]MCY1636238.1 carboxypeptidase-like regulatory domain-containing protein [Marinifilum sp. D737]